MKLVSAVSSTGSGIKQKLATKDGTGEAGEGGWGSERGEDEDEWKKETESHEVYV